MLQHTYVMTNDYQALPRLFLNLCLIKKGPQDIPNNPALLKGAFLCYFLLGSVFMSVDKPVIDAVILSFIGAILLGVFMYGILNFFSLLDRYNQSLTAMYGTGALIAAVSTPIMYACQAIANGQKIGVFGLVLSWLVVWSFAVMANIIHETIQKSFVITILLTVLYLYLSHSLVEVFNLVKAL